VATPSGLAPAVGRITIEQEDDGRILRLVGEIDEAAIAAFEAHVATSDASARSTTLIRVVDLAEVTYFSSAGVSFLLRQTRAAREQGQPPMLRGLVNPARRVLYLTGVAPLFHADC
jgi:anti-anti-sigma factor